MPRALSLIVSILPSFALADSGVLPLLPTRAIALSGDPVPGVPGRMHTSLSLCTINDAGEVVFGSVISPGTPAAPEMREDAVLRYTSDGTFVVARTGMPAPGLGGSFRSVSSPRAFNDRGDTVFSAEIEIDMGDAGLSNSSAVFASIDDQLRLLAQRDAPVPGLPGYVYLGEFRLLSLGADGTLASAFLVTNSDSGSEIAIHRYDDAGVTLLGGPESPSSAPSLNGATHAFVESPITASNGAVYFLAELNNDDALGIDNTNNRVIYRVDDAGTSVVFRSDDPRLDAPTGEATALTGFVTNERGEIVVRSTLSGPPIADFIFDELDPTQLHRITPDEFSLLVRAGEPAAGFHDRSIHATWHRFAINNAGDAVFATTLGYSDPGVAPFLNAADTTVYLARGGRISPIAVSAQPVSYPNGDFPTYFWLDTAVNKLADVAMRSFQVPALVDDVLTTYDPATEQLTVIAGEGYPFEVPLRDGTIETRIVDRVVFDFSETGGGSGLNNRRELAYTLSFTDGTSGVFVTTLGALPCTIADLEPPFGQLDLSDLDAFILAFLTQDPRADIAAPFGAIDSADIDAFAPAFVEGCP
ncbi:MAG: choice-of-anchor tandem repeat NxxGxxAF-containing protein [Planctomycetota bacterium]